MSILCSMVGASFLATAAVTQALNTALSTSNDYWRGNDMAYMGNDSSGRPVFCTGFTKVTTQYPTLIMFRVNLTDLTITKGSEYTLDGTNTAVYVSVASERDGSGLRTSSGFTDYGYAVWTRNALNTGARAVAFSYSLDNLTITLGTNIAIAGTTGGQGSGHYIGNRRVVGITNGGNNGNYLVQNWATRTDGATTLTKNTGADNSVLGFYGQGGGYNTKGMNSDRWIVVPQNGNNGHGWFVSAIRTNGSTGMVGVDYNYNDSTTDDVFNAESKVAQLNNTDRFITSCNGQFGNATFYGIKAMAGTVTWNTGATAPSLTMGTAVTLETNANYRHGLCEGTQDGEAFFIFCDNNDGLKIKFKKLTVSTNTISQSGYAVLSTIGNTGGYYVIDATRMVQVGSDWYMIIGARNSTNGNVDVIVVKNPQSYVEPRTAKAITTFGNAKITTAQSKFGGASITFDGTGDYLQIPDDDDFDFTQTNVTLEMWFRPGSAIVTDILMAKRDASNSGWQLNTTTSGAVAFQAYQGGSSIISMSGGTFTANSWHHVAVVKQGSVFKLYLNGTQVATDTLDTGGGEAITANTVNIGIGRYLLNTSFDYLGQMDEIRLSHSARYTSNFTPSSTAFTNDTDTKLLIHGDGNDANPSFFDDNSGNFT